MKKFNIDSIIFILIGLIIGTAITLSVMLVINNKKEEKIDNKELEFTAIKDNEEIDDYFDRLSTSEDKNVIKSGFVKVVDFLFYDEPIKGKKFSDLKESAKLKIIKAALYLDNKIDK